jgi:hypothetical protein
MVYLYSVISGFRAILGSIGVQLALFLSVVIMRPPSKPFQEPLSIDDADIQAFYETTDQVVSNCSKLYWQMLWTHLVCFISIALPQFFFEQWYNLCSLIVVVAMCFEVLLITNIC